MTSTITALCSALSLLFDDFDWASPATPRTDAWPARHRACGAIIATVKPGDRLDLALRAALLHQCEEREYCEECDEDITGTDDLISSRHATSCSLYSPRPSSKASAREATTEGGPHVATEPADRPIHPAIAEADPCPSTTGEVVPAQPERTV
ncbi:hypothetical protein [Nonomuraea jabiensis]|uniref:hypothetical protein n=1 Tax=Nonomuraea jabiensis TaxID=882448 RepID=UPI003D704684